MVKLRDVVLAIAVATVGAGCASFCNECDDFPMPGGPGGASEYSMIPGSYGGPPIGRGAQPEAAPAAAPATSAPAGSATEAAPTPPVPPSAGTPREESK